MHDASLQYPHSPRNMKGLPLFLDLEASSLNPQHSYPTEVAWSLPDGSIRSCLVQPVPEWNEWHPRVERLTGISRALIEESGRPPAEIANLLNGDLAGQTVYCDGGFHDRLWVKRLFQAAKRPCHFSLRDITQLIPPTMARDADWPGRLRDLKQQARRDAGPAHRADRDVAFLIRFYGLVARHLQVPG